MRCAHSNLCMCAKRPQRTQQGARTQYTTTNALLELLGLANRRGQRRFAFVPLLLLDGHAKVDDRLVRERLQAVGRNRCGQHDVPVQVVLRRYPQMLGRRAERPRHAHQLLRLGGHRVQHNMGERIAQERVRLLQLGHLEGAQEFAASLVLVQFGHSEFFCCYVFFKKNM